jgi:quinol monooxygenase YgiN
LLTVVAKMKALLGKEKELKKNLLDLVKPTHAEEDCIDYILHESLESPGTFLFYENWTSKEKLDQHLQTAHLKSFLGQVDQLLEGEVELSLWQHLAGH